MSKFVTSESVTEGHPDKICDQISDAVLDAILSKDPEARVACETMATTGMVIITGEIRTNTYVDIPMIAREVIKSIGYDDPSYGLDYQTCAVLTSIKSQSPDIAMGVDTGGAGDQGMMFGFATNETPEMMPLPIVLAHKLTRRSAEVRKRNILKCLRPDGKSQVSIEYDRKTGKFKRIDAIVLSLQHDPDVKENQLREMAMEHIIKEVIPENLVDKNTKYYINPTGRFVEGGPAADAGLTGRKIIVDTYGGFAPHGGGAFSGKDPTKVDRSGAYMARYVAKNIVAAGLADKCLVELAYAIGVAEPVSVDVETYGTGKIPDDELIKIIRKVFNLTPNGIIETLKLKRPVYRQTAAYGHFGREEEGFTWELTDMVEEIQKLV